MIRNIVVGLVVLLVVLVAVAFLLPQVAHVERSTVVKATPEEVFSVVNDLTRFNEWSPWAKMDPKTKYTIDAAPTGVGAKMSWTSDVVGGGSQEIVESVPFKLVKTKLEFGEQGQAVASFTLEPVEGGTKVVWGFDSDAGWNPIARYMGLMFDTWVGKDYQDGLANLKAVVESQADAATRAALADPGTGALPPDVPMAAEADPSKGPEVVTVAARTVITTRGSALASDDAAISGALGGAYQKILTFAEANAIEVGGGASVAVTISRSDGGEWAFRAEMPIQNKPAAAIAEADGVKLEQSYAGRAIKVTHKGGYSTLQQSYDRLHAYAKANNLKEKPILWEEYVGDPAETADDALLTNVYIAIQ
ncbi:MAG: SRPBCC family protein [Micropepsaceae bacterium]